MSFGNNSVFIGGSFSLSFPQIMKKTVLFCFKIQEGGKLIVCGENYYGQLGTGDDENVFKPKIILEDPKIKKICCGGYHTILLKTNGEVHGAGRNEQGQLGLGNEVRQKK